MPYANIEQQRKAQLACYHRKRLEPGFLEKDRFRKAKERSNWNEDKRAKWNAYYSSYMRKRRCKDPLFRLKDFIKSAIARMIKRIAGARKRKRGRWYLGGATAQHFAAHIESIFKPGMTWENHGEWHIDHIVPLASAKSKEELLPLLDCSNIQPLWAYENLGKNDKMPCGTSMRVLSRTDE